MKTKNLFLIATALLFASISFAQSKTTFGIRGGINFYSNNTKNDEGDKDNTKMVTGVNVGVNAEIPVGIDYYIQPGILFTTKGGKGVITETKLTISYIEIPVNFIYKPDLGSGHMLLGFGPYVAFGVGGKAGALDLEFTNEIKEDDPPGFYLKRLDAGLNFLVGYEWANRFSTQLNAGLGLANIYPKKEGTDIGETSIKNTGFGISLGYRFGK